MTAKKNKSLAMLIIVAALGYFVDIYDLVVFNVVKKESMAALGIPVEKEIFLFNMQMIGMLIGGILWGILGDKKGRISVLFGSIFLYSAANIANSFATGLVDYMPSWMRTPARAAARARPSVYFSGCRWPERASCTAAT